MDRGWISAKWTRNFLVDAAANLNQSQCNRLSGGVTPAHTFPMRDGPARGGTRGGKDQFNWDDVKSDKDREYYLGHSVKASVGRWQKGKDILWYTRGKGDGDDAAAEIAAIKAAEEQAMNDALGLKPKGDGNANLGQQKLDAREMVELLRRGRGDRGDDGARTRGIGGAGDAGTSGPGADREVMTGFGLSSGAGHGGGDDRRGGGGQGLSEREKDKLIKKANKLKRKDEKKSTKHAKKEAKRAKKDEKRKHRDYSRNGHGKRRSRSRSRSGSDSSSESDSDSR